MTDARALRQGTVDAAILCVAKLAIGVVALQQGFTHVSDDDYARTVIAERFAHAPRLDPSGTSWLPLPFWIVGAAMTGLGRSLSTARALALALGAASVAAPYAAMRSVGVRRPVALVATAAAMALPWNAWLGAATVPESWTGAALAAGAIAMGGAPAARAWGAAALLVAALSRYEAWPACALAAGGCAWRAVFDPERRRHDGIVATLAIAGPLGWMLWNAHAHGSALHFVARVSAFRQAAGLASLPLSEKLLGYPRALGQETPEAAVLGVLGALGLCASAALRRRWAWGAAGAAGVLAFLIAGDLGDGAPTHHPARALAALWWIFAGVGLDTLHVALSGLSARPRTNAAVLGASAVAGIAWCASLPARWRRAPGLDAIERREVQIARGADMNARDVGGAEITPCEFEHFALLAAWGKPERALVRDRLHRPPTPDCPAVIERVIEH